MSLRRTSGSAVIARFVRAAAFERSNLESRARAALGRAERATLQRLRSREARRDYLAAQWLARQLAAERTAASPLELSISHADGIALCALGEGCTFGVHVESMRTVVREQWAIVAKVFGVAERDEYHALPAAARPARLLATLACKEAVTKAMGVGIKFPRSRIVIDWVAMTTNGWQLTLWHPTERHVIALAAPKDVNEIHFEEVSPT